MMKLRGKILLPIGLSGGLVAAYLAWGWLPAGLSALGRGVLPIAALATTAVVLVVGAIAIDLLVTRPFAALTRGTGVEAPADPCRDDRSLGDEMRALQGSIDALHTAAARQQRETIDAEQRRKHIEAALQLSEERYALALRGSSDGLWEWDLPSGEMLLSPRWKSMLGFADSELPGNRQGWRERIHPADLAVVEAALEAHLAGSGEPYEQQIRMLHRDGGTRWFLSRATAIRHASGKPYRMVGLDTDVTRIRRIETILNEIVEGTANAVGQAFFQTLVQHFAHALQVPCAFITQCANHPTSHLRTLAFWSDGAFRDDFEYALPGTPCEAVVKEGRICFLRKDVGSLFPVEAGYEGYLGIPIFASDGQVIGHLAFLDTREMGDEMLVTAVYRVFAARAGAEMERKMAIDLLQRQAATPTHRSGRSRPISDFTKGNWHGSRSSAARSFAKRA